MNPEEIKNIKKQVKELEDTIEAEGIARSGLEEKIAKASLDEVFNISQFQKYHNMIYYYELEIEGMTGQKIGHPISEKDVENLAANGGRLYRGVDGTDSKIIPEMVGGGLLPVGSVPYELDRTVYINLLLRFLRTGTDESTYSNSIGGYEPGDTTILLENMVGSNVWVFMGQTCLIKLGTPSSIIPEPPIGGGLAGETTYSYDIIDSLAEVSTSQGVIVFNGFSNTQRASRNGGSLQVVMNTLIGLLDAELSSWLAVNTNKTYRACLSNMDTNFDHTAQDLARGINEYLVDRLYVTNSIGDSGLAQLETKMSERQSYIDGPRVAEIEEAKKLFYDLRINFINLRGDVQSGSLTRVLYMSALANEIPKGGTTQQQKALIVLKGLLEH